MSSRVGWSVLVLLFAGATAGRAQQEAEVVYKHYEECQNRLPRPDGCTISETRQLEPGGTLRIRIRRTKLSLYAFDVRGYAVRVSPDSAKQVALADARGGNDSTRLWTDSPNDTVTLELTHNAKYGGYVVTITPTKPIRGDSEEVPGADRDSKAQVPGAAVIVVVIDPQERPYAFSGGMSLTFLRSDVFVADPVASGYEIVNDTSRRDAGTVGFTTFVNVRVFNELQWFWPGIGIGVETGGNTQYYFGLGFRLQKGIFFNTGAVLGNVAVLPAGLEVGDSIADPNLLSNLDHRKKFSIFLGLSFTFLGGGQQAFSRPFAGGSDK